MKDFCNVKEKNSNGKVISPEKQKENSKKVATTKSCCGDFFSKIADRQQLDFSYSTRRVK